MRGAVLQWLPSITEDYPFDSDPHAVPREVSLREWCFWAWRVASIQIDWNLEVSGASTGSFAGSYTMYKSSDFTDAESYPLGSITNEVQYAQIMGNAAISGGVLQPAYGWRQTAVDYQTTFVAYQDFSDLNWADRRITPIFAATIAGLCSISSRAFAAPVATGFSCIWNATDPRTGEVFEQEFPFFQEDGTGIVLSGSMVVTPFRFYEWRNGQTGSALYNSITGAPILQTG